jgi:L-asparaginase
LRKPLLGIAEKRDLPHIVILATGGTIASTASTKTDTSNYRVTKGVEALIKAVPELEELAKITGEQVLNVSSQDLVDDDRLLLGKCVNEVIARDDVDGVVVTHGTETLEQTAYFLDLIVKSRKPVVVVGSIRPASAMSADGPMNLYAAVKVAGAPQSTDKGVLVVMNDRIGAARFISKTSSWGTDAFKSLEQGFLGDIVAGKVRFYQQPLTKHTYQTDFDISTLTALPKVEVLYQSYGNTDTTMVDAAIANGTEGIVLAGRPAAPAFKAMQEIAKRGISHEAQKQTEHLLQVIKKAGADTASAKNQLKRMASERGAVLVESFYQATGQNLYDTKAIVGSNSLNPHKSRILLQLALTKTTDPKQIQKYFDEY